MQLQPHFVCTSSFINEVGPIQGPGNSRRPQFYCWKLLNLQKILKGNISLFPPYIQDLHLKIHV